jgi:hypothetical protein
MNLGRRDSNQTAAAVKPDSSSPGRRARIHPIVCIGTCGVELELETLGLRMVVHVQYKAPRHVNVS